MQVEQSLCDGNHHLAGFFRCQRSLWQDLREILFRVFDHDIEEVPSVQSATPGVQELQQIGVRKLRGARPSGEMQLCRARMRKNKLDNCFSRWRTAVAC